jgi:serine/threonine-protein kinase
MLAEIDVGHVIAGKYELVRLIGKGAMGEVWLATHNSLGGEFAIKLVQPGNDHEDEAAAGRFQLEAQVSAKLSRKTRHIVSVSDHGEEGGLAYLVMELLEGESLEARIKRTGALDLPETVAIVSQVARALGQAHAEQIFHRDLKPANIFLTKDEDGRLLVKLLDFGIARTTKPFRTRSPFATGKDMVLGTPSYMSPEQARGLDTLDHRCDLWALAVVAYEALTETIPWDGETIEDIFLSICTHRMTPILSRRANLPPAIEGVFARSFAPKLDARFRSAAELSEAFENLVDPAALEAAMGPPVGRASSRNLEPPRLSSPTPGEMALGGPREPGSDPVGVAVGPPTISTRKKKSSPGWLLAIGAAVATITIVVLALTAFGARDKTTATSPPVESTSVTPATTSATVPAPEAPAATTTTATTTATTLATATTAPPPPAVRGTRAHPPPARSQARGVTVPSQPLTASPAGAAPPPAPPVVTAAPPTPPTPPTPPRAAPDKAEVF